MEKLCRILRRYKLNNIAAEFALKYDGFRIIKQI